MLDVNKKVTTIFYTLSVYYVQSKRKQCFPKHQLLFGTCNIKKENRK